MTLSVYPKSRTGCVYRLTHMKPCMQVTFRNATFQLFKGYPDLCWECQDNMTSAMIYPLWLYKNGRSYSFYFPAIYIFIYSSWMLPSGLTYPVNGKNFLIKLASHKQRSFLTLLSMPSDVTLIFAYNTLLWRLFPSDLRHFLLNVYDLRFIMSFTSVAFRLNAPHPSCTQHSDWTHLFNVCCC